MMNGPMMQALLHDGFGLKIHTETREVPIYALTIARGGNKMQRVEAGSCAQTDLSKAMEKPEPGAKPPCAGQRLRNGPNEVWQANGLSLDQLAERLRM